MGDFILFRVASCERATSIGPLPVIRRSKLARLNDLSLHSGAAVTLSESSAVRSGRCVARFTQPGTVFRCTFSNTKTRGTRRVNAWNENGNYCQERDSLVSNRRRGDYFKRSFAVVQFLLVSESAVIESSIVLGGNPHHHSTVESTILPLNVMDLTLRNKLRTFDLNIINYAGIKLMYFRHRILTNSPGPVCYLNRTFEEWWNVFSRNMCGNDVKFILFKISGVSSVTFSMKLLDSNILKLSFSGPRFVVVLFLSTTWIQANCVTIACKSKLALTLVIDANPLESSHVLPLISDETVLFQVTIETATCVLVLETKLTQRLDWFHAYTFRETHARNWPLRKIETRSVPETDWLVQMTETHSMVWSNWLLPHLCTSFLWTYFTSQNLLSPPSSHSKQH